MLSIEFSTTTQNLNKNVRRYFLFWKFLVKPREFEIWSVVKFKSHRFHAMFVIFSTIWGKPYDPWLKISKTFWLTEIETKKGYWNFTIWFLILEYNSLWCTAVESTIYYRQKKSWKGKNARNKMWKKVMN